MKNNIITIIKKEFVRFFGDKRLVLSTVLLPGILIYVLYSFMGKGLMSQFETAEDYTYKVSVENMPESMSPVFDKMHVKVKDISKDDESDTKQAIKDKECDLMILFPKDFDIQVKDYDLTTSKEEAPEIQMYYNTTKTESGTAYQMMTETFNTFEGSLVNKFDLNRGDKGFDLASDKDTTGKMFAMMLPMFMMMFLYSGCAAIAPESIAGEKERGTIATLLVTPLKRNQLAIGKIISLGVIGLLSGISSFIGTMLSLPSLVGEEASKKMSAGVYQISDYALLLCVILTTVLILVGSMAVISAFAKSVKEAGTTILPLMVVIMVVAVSTMMGSGAPTQPYVYLIPFYNSVQCMNSIFSFAVVPLNVIITIVSNIVYTLVLAGGLAKIFDSEKMMYL